MQHFVSDETQVALKNTMKTQWKEDKKVGGSKEGKKVESDY